MITGIMFQTAKETLDHGFLGLMLYIDGVVYRLAGLLYRLFYKLAGAQLFQNDVYEIISGKVYMFVGIISLFVISFYLLTSIVNPDEINKGVIKSFKSLITSVILIILMPTIFTYVFSLQSAIFEDKIIDQLFNFKLYKNTKSGNDEYLQNVNNICNLKDKEEITLQIMDRNGSRRAEEIWISNNDCRNNYMIMTVLEGFFTPTPPGNVTNPYGTKYSVARKYMIYSGNFNYIHTYIKNVESDEESNSVGYAPVLSTAAGIFLCYIILSFCIDLGVRCVKLAFYELISPIPILMRMLPSKEAQFNKWVSQTVACFLEVFTRVIIITFVMFLARNLMVILDNINLGQDLNFIGKTIILLGMLTFAKQAPKLLQDALGIEGGGIALGIKDKLTSVPIAGRAFNAGYGLANRVRGGVTGALGAGWSSAQNGGTFMAGAKYGLARGFGKGGGQFNAQRQALYTDIGGKGKAGWFGGQNRVEKWGVDAKNSYVDDYKDRVLPGLVESARSKSKVWNAEYDAKLKKARRPHEEAIKNLKASIADTEKEIRSIEEERDKFMVDGKTEMDAKIATINSERDKFVLDSTTEMDAKIANINFGKSKFESDSKTELDTKIAEIDAEKKKYEAKYMAGEMSEERYLNAKKIFFKKQAEAQREYNSKIAEYSQRAEAAKSRIQQDYDNKVSAYNQRAEVARQRVQQDFNKTVSGYNDSIKANNEKIQSYNDGIKVSQDKLDAKAKYKVIEKDAETGKYKVVTKEMNKLELDARKSADGVLKDASESFKQDSNVLSQRINEKELNARRDTAGFQESVAIYEQALKNLGIGKDGAPSGGPAAATQNVGKPNNDNK